MPINFPMAQIDPSDLDGYAYYQIKDSTGSVLAEIIATNTPDVSSGSGMVARTEYWRIPGNSFKTATLGTLTVHRQNEPWSTPPPYISTKASFSVSVDAQWTTSNGPVSAHAPSTPQKNGGDDDAAFDVNVSSDSKGTVWNGTMTFCRSTDQLVFANIPGGLSCDYNETNLTSTTNKVLQVCQINVGK